jgi:hypothetical protein
MSDAAHRMSFLSGLVGHAFGLEPALQPRKASLFEPRAGAAAVSSFGESTAHEFFEPAAAASPAEVPLADHSTPQPETRSALFADPMLPEIASGIESAAPKLTALVEPPLAPPSHIVTTSENFTLRDQVSRVDRVVEGPVEHIRDIMRHADDPPPPRRAREPRAEFLAEPIKPRHENPAPISPALLAQPVAQDLVAPRAEASDRRVPITTLFERAPPQGPVVNVTIGRVEVRAHPAPTRASTDRRGAKPMSLDDYLKRRGGP